MAKLKCVSHERRIQIIVSDNMETCTVIHRSDRSHCITDYVIPSATHTMTLAQAMTRIINREIMSWPKYLDR